MTSKWLPLTEVPILADLGSICSRERPSPRLWMWPVAEGSTFSGTDCTGHRQRLSTRRCCRHWRDDGEKVRPIYRKKKHPNEIFSSMIHLGNVLVFQHLIIPMNRSLFSEHYFYIFESLPCFVSTFEHSRTCRHWVRIGHRSWIVAVDLERSIFLL